MRKLDSLGSEEAKGRGVDFVLHAQPIAQSDGVTLFFFQVFFYLFAISSTSPSEELTFRCKANFATPKSQQRWEID